MRNKCMQCATITPRGLVCSIVGIIFGDVVYDSLRKLSEQDLGDQADRQVM